MLKKCLLFLIGLALVGCGRRENPVPPAANSAPPPARSAAAATSAAPVVPAASAPAVFQPAGPPRKVVKADGFNLTEHADGQVRIETTDLWNQKLETTYADCDYFEKAVPVLERQLTPERGSKLKQVCFHKKR